VVPGFNKQKNENQIYPVRKTLWKTRMAKKPTAKKTIETLTHDADKRKNGSSDQRVF
jgi:hypothetical protein